MITAIQKFLEGNSFDAYNFFGAHKHWKSAKQGYIFRVYAPNADCVKLIGSFTQWQEIPMERSDEGVYSVFVEGVRSGEMYKYRVYEKDGNISDRADPFGFAAQLRPDTASVTTFLNDFEFSDYEWCETRPSDFYNIPINIYEFHFGSWKHKDNSSENIEDKWFSYSEIAEDVINYLKENHFTHIEIMPITEYPFDGSWGYQVSGFFSATSRYGLPKDLMYFINECHLNGIGVIIDFVPVHFVGDTYALAKFDGTPVYEYPEDDIAYSEWGSCNFNFYRGESKSFIKSAANFWLCKYHADGLRMDAISNAIYWQGKADRGVNTGGVKFLQELCSGLKQRNKNIMLMAEDSSNFVKVTAPVEYDGLGFDFKWDMGWMHDTLEYFQMHPYDRRYEYHKLTFSMCYFYDNLYLLPFSHDECVHGKASVMQKMWGDYEYKFPQAKTMYTFMFTHPGKKLNFMGNEIGQFREWDEKQQNDWLLLKYPNHDAFYHYFRKLSEIYTTYPSLYCGEYHSGYFKWLEIDAPDDCVYVYMRECGGNPVIIALNTSLEFYEKYRVGCDEPLIMREILNSDSYCYGGKGRDNASDAIVATRALCKGKPYSFTIDLAPLSACIFEVTGKESRKVIVRRN